MARSGRRFGGSPPIAGPPATDMTLGDYATGVPSIRVGEMFRSLFRQLPWVLILTAIGSVGLWFAFSGMKRTYHGDGRLLVQLGSEYVYEAVGSERNSQSMLLTPDIISLNEAAIMKNSAVIEQVIGELVSEFGEDRFARSIFKDINAAKASGSGDEYSKAMVSLHKFMDRNYVVMPQPKSSVVNVVYKHEDPDIAVAGANACIDAYLSYRRTIFIEGSGDVIAERRITTEEQLDKTETAIQAFLRRNGISDFVSERTGVTERTENLRAELNALRASMTESEAALASVEAQLRQTPAQINLYVDDRAAQRVAQAELELKQLLAKYLPTSDPVRAKQIEINELKALQRANGGNAVGGRRVGPNAVYQELMTRRNTLQSTADSYREKEYALVQQLKAADAKVKKLQRLSPQYSNLIRERDTLDARLKDYTNQEQQALVNQQQAETNSENVRVISYATLPRKGRNMGKLYWALGTVGWGFTLFMLAMLKVFLDPKLYRSPLIRAGRRAADREDAVHREEITTSPSAQPFVPEPVPSRRFEPPETAPPIPTPNARPVSFAGAAAHDVYTAPESAFQPDLGTIPSTDKD